MASLETDPPPTFLRGRRMTWGVTPEPVRAWAETVLGGPITGWSDRVGGMSTGFATVLHGTDAAGRPRSIFVKGVDEASNPQGVKLCLAEAHRSARLGPLPHVPPLLAHGEIPDGDDRWAVLAFPALPGRAAPHPWRAATLTRVLTAWQPLARQLARTPWDAPTSLTRFFTGWHEIAQRPDDPWLPLAERWTPREDRLVGRVAGTPGDPPILAQIDLRADNIVLADRPDGPSGSGNDVWFVDWAHPGLAARWVDLAVLLCDVVGSGGDVGDGGDIDVLDVWAHDEVAGAYDPTHLVDVVGCLAAVLHAHSQNPPHPALPHQRPWERTLSERMLPFVLRHG